MKEIASLFLLLLSVNQLVFADPIKKGTDKNITISAFQSCVSINNDTTRLACFDQLSANLALKTETPSKTITAETVATAAISSTQKESDFAKEHLKKTTTEKAQEITSITSTIKKLKKLVRGQWVIYLENGQKWQQKDSTKIKLKVGDTIRLKKGAMSAVYLYKANSHKNIRVKRLL